jgi:hypothetical protein
MSTVMRPVGPLPPRVYWIRRSIILGVILIVILLLATQCGGGGGGGKKGGSPTTPNSNTTTTTPQSAPACTSTNLNITVSTDTTRYTSGQAPTLTATLANTGTTDCKLARNVSNEIWTIKSGSPVVWTTKGCSADPVAASIKVAAGATKQIHTTWNGYIRGPDCKDTTVAAPGHYRLSATIDGVKATNPSLFTIVQ